MQLEPQPHDPSEILMEQNEPPMPCPLTGLRAGQRPLSMQPFGHTSSNHYPPPPTLPHPELEAAVQRRG